MFLFETLVSIEIEAIHSKTVQLSEKITRWGPNGLWGPVTPPLGYCIVEMRLTGFLCCMSSFFCASGTRKFNIKISNLYLFSWL